MDTTTHPVSTSPKRAASARLNVGDWLDAGYAVVAQNGLAALKLSAVCKQAGASAGSFYWHFTDIESYREALVESWSDCFDAHRRSMMSFDHLPARERLAAMIETLISERYWVLERSMREWARSNPAAAANIRAADRSLLREVTRAFREIGLSREEALFRGELIFAAGIGLLHLAGSADEALEAVQRHPILEFMLAGP